MGGKFHPRLNINTRPIANKYHEGKVKRTLKRGLKVHETVMGEANAAVLCACSRFTFCFDRRRHRVQVGSVSCQVEITLNVSILLREK